MQKNLEVDKNNQEGTKKTTLKKQSRNKITLTDDEKKQILKIAEKLGKKSVSSTVGSFSDKSHKPSNLKSKKKTKPLLTPNQYARLIRTFQGEGKEKNKVGDTEKRTFSTEKESGPNRLFLLNKKLSTTKRISCICMTKDRTNDKNDLNSFSSPKKKSSPIPRKNQKDTRPTPQMKVILMKIKKRNDSKENCLVRDADQRMPSLRSILKNKVNEIKNRSAKREGAC